MIGIGAGNAVTGVFQEGFRLETIEEGVLEKEKKDVPQSGTPQATANTTPATSGSGSGNVPPVLNPDEVLRQASQLRLGDTIN